MDDSYIKIYRSMLDWEWYQDTSVKALFLHLLLRANWKAGRFQGTDVPPGSFVTTLERLSVETGLGKGAVRCALEKLKKTGEIRISTTQRFTLISLVNYAVYQKNSTDAPHTNSTQTAHEQHTDSTRTAHEQHR